MESRHHNDGGTVVRVQHRRAAGDCAQLHGDSVDRLVSWSAGGRAMLVPNDASVVSEFVLDGGVELFSFSLE